MPLPLPSPSPSSSSRPFWRSAAVAALCLSAWAASAPAATVTSQGGSAAPGQVASVVFDIDFGALTTVSSLDFHLDWDAARLSFASSAVTYQGAPYDAVAALSAAGTFFPPTGTTSPLTALWLAVDPVSFAPTPALQLSGHARLTFGFTLDPAFPVGTTTPVHMTLGWADAAGVQPALPQLDASAAVSTPVPEASTAAMLLAGGLLCLGWGRPTRRRPA